MSSSRRLERSADQATRSRGLIRAVCAVFAWLVVSLLLSIVVDWVGLNWLWRDQGLQRGQQLYHQELSFLGDARTGGRTSARVLAMRNSDLLHRWLCRHTGVTQIGQALSRRATVVSWRDMSRSLGVHIKSIEQTIRVFGLRLTALTISMPIVLLFALVGTTEGLIARDLRRWGGGRESSYLFHHAKRATVPLLGIPAMIYLTFPFAMDVSVIVLPIGFTLGTMSFLVVRSFKKYL